MPAGRKARRFGVLVAVGAALTVFAAPTADARFDSHFHVIGETIRGGGTADDFRFREALFNPNNLNNRVGWLKARCRDNGKRHCRAVFHFDGSIGGFGELFAKGNFGGRDHTLNVHDGNGTFSGDVAGKVEIDPIDRNTTHYSFHLVDVD